MFCSGNHNHGVRPVAVLEVYIGGTSIGLFCENHAISYAEDPNAAFRAI